MQRQLPLPLSPTLVPSFDNYCRGANGLAVDMVQGFRISTDVNQLYLWGGLQCGKSHLLLAAHNDFVNAGQQSFYASIKDSSLSEGLLEALDGYALVALDDIDSVAGSPAWELALFNLINFTRERGGKLIFSASAAPAAGDWQLADLVSRLSWGPVAKLEALNDSDVRQALIMAVDEKGLQMPDETINYLLKRHDRDVNSLLEVVALLDRESLAAGRARITIPFLKTCLAQLNS